MERSIGKTLKAGTGVFLLILVLNLVYALPTSLEQVVPAIVVSAVVALLTVVVGWIYESCKERKDRR